MTTTFTFKLRRDSIATWASRNPVLADGEPGLERQSDGTFRVKYGDGVHHWLELDYAGGGGNSSLAFGVGHDEVRHGDDSAYTDQRAPRDASVTTAKFASTFDPSIITGTAIIEGDSRLTNSRTPNAHAASHSASGSDPLSLTQAQIIGLTTALSAKADATALTAEVSRASGIEGGKVNLTSLGVALGVATLGADAKLLISQMPFSSVRYLGTLNASNNTTGTGGHLGDGTGTAGDEYKVTVAGTTNFGSGPITFNVGDWAILNGSLVWERSQASDTVASVFGRTGPVTAQTGDYTKTQVGLGSVDNTSDVSKPISTLTQTALDGKQAASANLSTLAGIPPGTAGLTVLSQVSAANIKQYLGLDQLDNTTDLLKPISSATQTALNLKVPTSRTVNGQPLSGDVVLTAGGIGADPAGTAAALVDDLSGVTDPTAARANIGIGTIATHPASDFLATSALGVANGVAQLDGASVLPVGQVPTLPLTKIANQATDTLLGRALAAGTGPPTVLSVAQVQALLGLGTAAYAATTAFQTASTDLAAIAALTPTNNDVLQRKAGAWVNRSISQLKTDLAYGTAANHPDTDFVLASLLGAINGVATLDGSGRIPVAQLSLGTLEYMGTWNAGTNTPDISISPRKGDQWKVATAGGTQFGVTFDVGDYAIYNGTAWEKSDTTDAVSSVAGRFGAVTLGVADLLGLGANTVVVNNTAGSAAAAALALTASTVLGRKATGNVVALTGSDISTIMGLGTSSTHPVGDFLQLAGIAGGQSAIGGTGAWDFLTLQASTSPGGVAPAVRIPGKHIVGPMSLVQGQHPIGGFSAIALSAPGGATTGDPLRLTLTAAPGSFVASDVGQPLAQFGAAPFNFLDGTTILTVNGNGSVATVDQPAQANTSSYIRIGFAVGLSESYLHRASDLYILHRRTINSTSTDPWAQSPLHVNLKWVNYANANVGGDTTIPGPAGVIQVDGSILYGSTYPDDDNAGATLINSMRTFGNVSGQSAFPGGLLNGSIFTDQLIATAATFGVTQVLPHTTNLNMDNLSSGITLLGQYVGWSNQDWIRRSDPTGAVEAGLWTSFWATPPINPGSGAIVNRVSGFDYGSPNFRQIHVKVVKADGSTPAGGDYATGLVTLQSVDASGNPVYGFSQDDVGMQIGTWNGTRLLGVTGFGISHNFIRSVSTDGPAGLLGSTGSMVTLACPTTNFVSRGVIAVGVQQSHLAPYLGSAVLDDYAARFAGPVSFYPTGNRTISNTGSGGTLAGSVQNSGAQRFDLTALTGGFVRAAGWYTYSGTSITTAPFLQWVARQTLLGPGDHVFNVGSVLASLGGTIENDPSLGAPINFGPTVGVKVSRTIQSNTNANTHAYETGFYHWPVIQGISPGTITTDNLYGVQSLVTVGTGGTVTNRYGVRVHNATLSGGAITNQYGVYVENLTGATNNWAAYLSGTTVDGSGNLSAFRRLTVLGTGVAGGSNVLDVTGQAHISAALNVGGALGITGDSQLATVTSSGLATLASLLIGATGSGFDATGNLDLFGTARHRSSSEFDGQATFITSSGGISGQDALVIYDGFNANSPVFRFSMLSGGSVASGNLKLFKNTTDTKVSINIGYDTLNGVPYMLFGPGGTTSSADTGIYRSGTSELATWLNTNFRANKIVGLVAGAATGESVRYDEFIAINTSQITAGTIIADRLAATPTALKILIGAAPGSSPTWGTALPGGITATTQTAADGSAKVATTAYVDAERANTATLTNKRLTKRVTTVTTATTPTINTDSVDEFVVTALSGGIVMSTNLSGTPTDGQEYHIALTDNGTARAITWGTSFEASGTVTLPTTTVISTRLDCHFVWNVASGKWRIQWKS